MAFTEFPNETALGEGLSADTLQYLVPRPDVARDCTYLDSSGRGRYCGKRTVREHGGVLGQYLHTEQQADCRNPVGPVVHNGNGNCNYVGGLKWTLPNQDDFIVSFVARFDDIPGRKVAILRWCGPRFGTAGYCEDNFPEEKIDGGTCEGNAFHHHESRKTQNRYQLCTDLNDWHLYQMHVKPGQFVDFYLDGVLKGHATEHVTTRSSYFVFQLETYLSGQVIPEPDNAGWVELDAFAVDLPG